MMGETPGSRLTRFQAPGTTWAASLRTRGLHDHRQPDGAEQIKEVREVSSLAPRATLPCNEAAQQEGQQTDKSGHAHLLVGPMILRADRQVVHGFALATGRRGLTLAVLGCHALLG